MLAFLTLAAVDVSGSIGLGIQNIIDNLVTALLKCLDFLQSEEG